MTLYELIQIIEDVAIAQPSVQMVVENDVYRLNEIADARYGVFAFTQGAHAVTADNDLITYNLTLFYVDRLADDNSNQIEVQSTGVMVLDNILMTLSERGVVVGDYSLQPFNQRFADMCAGIYASVALSVPRTATCPELYDNMQGKEVR